MTSNPHTARLLALAATLVLFVALFFFMPSAQAAYENVSFLIKPTAERAYEYGSRHFDAKHAADYDLERAEHFFLEAAKHDPTFPYVYHQLARISFLKGDFDKAISQINFQISQHGDSAPNSYYVRGLIEGFMGDYEAAIRDYEIYLRSDPNNWAAINDYAWVKLKADRSKDALVSLDWGLLSWPENPWLHNSRATALFEMGRLEEAQESANAASRSVANLTEAEWLQAYPGNDPLIAPQGIEAFKKAVAENMHTIELALEKAEKDVR